MINITSSNYITTSRHDTVRT